MRASGRPPHSHRDPARPVRGGDRSGLSLGALAHRLMALRATLTRRLAGSAAGPSRVGYGSAGRRADPSGTPPPAVRVGRGVFERAARPGYGAEAAWPGQTGPVPAGQAWPSGIFDDRATPGASVPSRAESRIDRQASSPGVLVRQPRRPDAIAPEEPFAPVSAAPPPQASSVRFTRTPDTVLQERRQRALEAERVALERARAEAQAAAQAVEAERKAREEAQALLERQAEEAASRGEVIQSEEPMRALAGVPRWQQPFVANPGVRYFRTPDRRPTPVQAVPAAAAPAPEPAPETRDW